MAVPLNNKKGIKRYAMYAGVIAAAMIFGSWTVTNFLFQNVSDYRGKLATLDATYSEAETQDDIFRKLGNVEKLVYRSRNKELPADLQRLDSAVVNMYYATLEFEINQSFYDDWIQVYKKLRKVVELCKSIDAPQKITDEAIAKSKWCDSLYDSFVNAMHMRDSSIKAITGRNGISLARITKDQALAVTDIAYDFIKKIRETGISKDYIDIVNSRYKILRDLKRWAQKTLDKFEIYSGIFKWASLILYILGTCLAIYGKWFETKQKESVLVEE